MPDVKRGSVGMFQALFGVNGSIFKEAKATEASVSLCYCQKTLIEKHPTLKQQITGNFMPTYKIITETADQYCISLLQIILIQNTTEHHY